MLLFNGQTFTEPYEKSFLVWFEENNFHPSCQADMELAWRAAKEGPCDDCKMQERGS